MSVPEFSSANSDTKPPPHPNLLFVLSDQQSYDMLGCYGNTSVISPNIDRFASQGVRFNYCISQSPVCTPYRGMLMSGQHPLHNGAFHNDVRLMAGRGNYFGEVLRDAGYRVGYVGKWHLYGGDRDRPVPPGRFRYGFDGEFLTNNCTVDLRPGHCYYWNQKNEKVFFDEWEPYGQTRQALKFIDDCSDDQPFALFVSLHPPHDNISDSRRPYDTLRELMDAYDPAGIKLRPNCADTPDVRRDYQGYMAMCTGIDIVFGRLIGKLKARGLDRNTMVVYTSDHGDMLHSNGRPSPKGYPEDLSLRVPLIIRSPGRLKAGVATDLLVGTLDLMPSILGMMGLTVPNVCQGRNLSQAILSARHDAVESLPLFLIYSAQGNQGWRGIYTRRYTYAFDEGLDSKVRCDCLYDRITDSHQRKNLFHAPECRSIREGLHRQTLKGMDRFGDTFVPGATVTRVCLGEEGQPKYSKGAEGQVKARPIDLLKSISYSVRDRLL